jgi:UDP-glucose 4-epimerase
LTKSDFHEPVNIGSDEMVSMNEMAEIVLSFEDRKLPIHHIPGPEGVRGRNSDNTLIKEKLGWAPTMKLKVCHNLISFHLYCNNSEASIPSCRDGGHTNLQPHA